MSAIGPLQRVELEMGNAHRKVVIDIHDGLATIQHPRRAEGHGLFPDTEIPLASPTHQESYGPRGQARLYEFEDDNGCPGTLLLVSGPEDPA